MAGRVKVSLAEAYPEVAATWHPTRNRPVTPDQIGTGGGMMWWSCPAGHEWEETVVSRRSLPKWKRGDIAACRECSGTAPFVRTFPGCGCTKKVRPGTREAEHGRCHACRTRDFETNAPRVKEELSKAAKAAAGRAGRLLDTVAIPDDVPAPLLLEWRWWASKHLQGAIAAEQVLERTGKVEAALARAAHMAPRLTPTPGDIAAAAARDGVLRLLEAAHWAEGWGHALSGEDARPVDPGFPADIAAELSAWLSDWAEGVREDRTAGRPVPSGTAGVTRALTGVIQEFLRAAVEPHGRVYRELRLPVLPDGAVRYGRVDVAAWSPTLLPDFVVEIDSAPNPSSVRKLEFVRDAGAVPLWVRFGAGPVEDITGVGIVDARDLVRTALASDVP
ncbi:zinc-ribbon domain-containing protein [Streptomyces sp. NPDC006512]|uniref:zinc-ribbon domain-containing protein n=1 Tax=Streptomyces sp. NPDC006512 TaxID=3154307 RepID=UPI0033B02306